MIIVRLVDLLRGHMRGVVRVSLAILALLVVGDWFLVGIEEAHTAAEGMFGFWSLFGLLSCLAIIFVSKGYGHLGIMKREDYYGDDRDD